MQSVPLLKVSLMTGLALAAFAANSVLTRLALAEPLIDAASFTGLRLLSGAVMLMLILVFRDKHKGLSSSVKGNWKASLSLFVYAAGFSYAYLLLGTAMGALILFGMVQLTMVGTSIAKGKRLRLAELLGIAMALFGLMYLVWPALQTPALLGVLLMSSAGIAWGIYTLLGRGSGDPLADTAYNFLRTLPFLILLIVVSFPQLAWNTEGAVLAILSGALASGLGYTVWYSVLPYLSATQAGVLQLLVPVIAAFGGVMFVAEPVSMRLMVATVLILTGILLVMLLKQKNTMK